MTNTLVKQSLYISQELGKKYTYSYSYLLLDTLTFYSSQRFRKPDYLTENSIIEFISTLTNKYKEFWEKKIESSTKLDFYRKFKHDFKAEEISREQRFCEFCNRDEVEDENHIIFSCKTYKDIRETFFSKNTLPSKYQPQV